MSNEKIAFLASVNSALLKATKLASVKEANVDNRVKAMKAVAKIAFSPTKLIAGDHKSKLAMKIPATSRLMSPLKVKQVLINC